MPQFDQVLFVVMDVERFAGQRSYHLRDIETWLDCGLSVHLHLMQEAVRLVKEPSEEFRRLSKRITTSVDAFSLEIRGWTLSDCGVNVEFAALHEILLSAENERTKAIWY